MSTDKRILLYEAALRLIEDKHDMSSIKVADIAKAADIGKGTVYEYFDSKEQLLAEAIIYYTRKGMKSLEDGIKKNGGLKEIYTATIKQISHTLTKSKVFFQYMVFNECNFSVKKALQSLIEENLENLRKAYMVVFEKIIDIGVAEGVLRKKPDKFDWFIAFSNSVTCVAALKHGLEEFSYLEEEEVLEKSYEMFVKMLN